MDGRMNCHLTAENAAFTKLRHLENRVVETETRLDVLEQETTQLDEALQNVKDDISETIVTENVDTGLLRADSIGTALLTADDINVKDMTATTIEAETINVDNLENVNVLRGKTVDVNKTIATIGQFTKTQTNVSNNSTTNTDKLNVETEANLKGQVNIDGNVTFTKDNGLSKLQGNYLEIDAAKVVIDNKNNAEYALLVPGINGDALFGGSVAVQDTLAVKNLAVTGETYFKYGFTLDSPTLKNIKDGGYSTTALDVDSKGKVVKVKLAANIPGAAEMLEANVTRYVSELNPILQRGEDDRNFVFQVDTNTFLPMVYDGERPDEPLAAIPNGDAADPYFTCSHLDNIYYIKGSEYLKYNITTGATTAVAQIDESKTYRTMSILGGKVLNEDIPAYYCANDNKMYSLLDGSELEVSFTINPEDEVLTVYADKNGKTYVGIVSTDTSFNSILDEGQGVLFEVPGMSDGDGKGYAVNCPAAIMDEDGNGRLFNGGQPVDVAEDSLYLYRLVKDGTYIYSAMGLVYTYNENDTYAVLQPSRVYNFGYFAGFDYITNTPYTEKKIEVSTENVFVAKDIPVEINGKYFVDGRWYDKVVTSYEEFMQFIVDTEQNYVSSNNYPKYFDVLYNNDGSEVISSNPWNTAVNALNTEVKHFYRLIGLRSNMNGDGYFGIDSMTGNGSLGGVRDIESKFTIEQNFDFFAPPAVLNGNLLYENIEFRYVNGFFTSSKVSDLKNCNIFIEGEWTNAQNRVTFERCEDVYFTAAAVNFNTGDVRYYDFNGCNGMFVDTLISSFQPEIKINLSTMLLIKCTSSNVTQYGPGANAHYVVTGRKEITLI